MTTPDFSFIYSGHEPAFLIPDPSQHFSFFTQRMEFKASAPPGQAPQVWFSPQDPVVSCDWQLIKWRKQGFYTGGCSPGLSGAPVGGVSCGPQGWGTESLPVLQWGTYLFPFLEAWMAGEMPPPAHCWP